MNASLVVNLKFFVSFKNTLNLKRYYGASLWRTEMSWEIQLIGWETRKNEESHRIGSYLGSNGCFVLIRALPAHLFSRFFCFCIIIWHHQQHLGLPLQSSAPRCPRNTRHTPEKQWSHRLFVLVSRAGAEKNYPRFHFSVICWLFASLGLIKNKLNSQKKTPNRLTLNSNNV